MIKNEAAFQTLFSRGWKKITKSYEKIPDTGFHQKRYDCWGLYKGIYYGMELKFLKKAGSFNFNLIEPHQYENLIEDSLNGGKCYVIVGIHCELTEKQRLKFNIQEKVIKTAVYQDINWWINKRSSTIENRLSFNELLELPRLKFTKNEKKKEIVDITPLLRQQ